MIKTWITADPHFSHWGMCKFLRKDGTKLRPWDHPDDMDNALIKNWNSVVSDEDRVYILGDLCINRRGLNVIANCKGRKVLIKGNHDIFKPEDYLPNFDDIRAYEVKPKLGIIMSHIPVHPRQLTHRFGLNIHGHTHDGFVEDKWGKPDPLYKCVSMEHTNYTPINLQEVIDGTA